MNESSSERVGPMLNPPHLGELIRESMTMQMVRRPGDVPANLFRERGTLSRLLNGRRAFPRT